MTQPMTWPARFVDFSNYLRDCGWRQPIVMRGRRVMVVGVMSPRQGWGVHHNDNRGKV